MVTSAPSQPMTADEFDSKRAALITLLNQRIGQSNWSLASEACAELLELEAEWISQRDSAAQYRPLVYEMNQKISVKGNSFDRQLLQAVPAINV